MPGVSILGEVLADSKSDSTKSKGQIKYAHDQFNGKLTFTSDPLIDIALTFGKPQYGLGLNAAWCCSTNKLTAYNAALFFNFDD